MEKKMYSVKVSVDGYIVIDVEAGNASEAKELALQCYNENRLECMNDLDGCSITARAI